MNIRKVGWLRKIVYVWRNFRSQHSYINGKNNKINIRGQKVGSRIQICGNGNTVIVEDNALLFNSIIRISGNNNLVKLKSDSYVSGAELWVEDNGCEIEIGERTFVGHHTHLACTEDGRKLYVGNDCMISSYVQIRTGDSHSILDLDGNRINKAESVRIGDHCWLGEGSKILKGVILDGNNIVATGAIVTKSFGRNTLIAGVPGKLIKENVTWDKERI